MDITHPLSLLGGLSAEQFMKRHWQKKPLLVRGAVPGFAPLLSRSDLFALAGRDEVESRLIVRSGKGWSMRRGPLGRRQLPPLAQPGWTLLVQGVDLHAQPAHDLLARFRFVPEARLDDLMISYATDGGGVGPHFDSYDVFLLQAQGRRRWRYGRQKDFTLQEDVPLKILADFSPEQDVVLEPGDMLYLPPRWAHDGIAIGECQTISIGFRSPARPELARELLQRLAEEADELVAEGVYRDPAQLATTSPGAIPEGMQVFARAAVRDALSTPSVLDRALGEVLTELKANVWFDPGPPLRTRAGVVLDRRTRMMHDARHIFVNGESWRAGGRDATLMRRLADQRRLAAADLARASDEAMELLGAWCEAGWLHELTGADDDHQR